jgi:catechol 2,3-dioxygenase-like lactoylglutathione lyase family enzyme
VTDSLQGFDHVALPVSDLARAVAFYRDVLGMRSVDRRDPETDDYHWLNLGPGQTLNLSRTPESTQEAVGPGHVAFRASESFLATLSERLADAGVDYHETETSLYFSDPDGNDLEVTCWREKRLRESGRDHW